MSITSKLSRHLRIALGKAAGSELETQINTVELPDQQYATNTATADATATGAQVAGAEHCVLNLTGTLAAGHNLTTPTAAQIVAAIPNAVVGQTYRLRIINSSSGAFSWTVVAGTGVTLTGTATVAQNTWREWIVTLTTLTAVAMQAVGTGTQS